MLLVDFEKGKTKMILLVMFEGEMLFEIYFVPMRILIVDIYIFLIQYNSAKSCKF